MTLKELINKIEHSVTEDDQDALLNMKVEIKIPSGSGCFTQYTYPREVTVDKTYIEGKKIRGKITLICSNM